jgi:hypothetical protein
MEAVVIVLVVVGAIFLIRGMMKSSQDEGSDVPSVPPVAPPPAPQVPPVQPPRFPRTPDAQE